MLQTYAFCNKMEGAIFLDTWLWTALGRLRVPWTYLEMLRNYTGNKPRYRDPEGQMEREDEEEDVSS
jgi:hypothetical protein